MIVEVETEVEVDLLLRKSSWISGLASCASLSTPLTKEIETTTTTTTTDNDVPPENNSTSKLYSLLLVVGGVISQHQDYPEMSEVFMLDNEALTTCQRSFDLPVGLKSPTGNVIRSIENGQSIPIICGGYSKLHGSEEECYKLGGDAETPFASLSDAKYGSASILLNYGQTLWVTGG